MDVIIELVNENGRGTHTEELKNVQTIYNGTDYIFIEYNKNSRIKCFNFDEVSEIMFGADTELAVNIAGADMLYLADIRNIVYWGNCLESIQFIDAEGVVFSEYAHDINYIDIVETKTAFID